MIATGTGAVNVDGHINNNWIITLASSRNQASLIVIGKVTPSGAGARTLTDREVNRISSGASGSTLDNQGPINGAGKIFSIGATPPQIFNPTDAI